MSASPDTDVLVIGAGPFGLAAAVHLQRRGVDVMVIGKAMEFWKRHMPAGMFLRSGVDWHLDSANEWTNERFLESTGRTADEVQPFPLDVYLEYVDWFSRRGSVEVHHGELVKLDWDDARKAFIATLSSRHVVSARRVVVAIGFANFANVPGDIGTLLPAGRFEHTCTAVDLRSVKGQRCLIVGGRQSAFEWAALLAEGGASVDVAYRHDTPRFTESQWAWAGELVQRFVHEPGWFRRLAIEERDALGRRFWEEGRLKLEPWLAPRLRAGGVRLWPRRQVTHAQVQENGAIAVAFQAGESIEVDRVILATGYRPDIARVPFIAAGNLLAELEIDNDCPRLDDHMESSVEGLYFTSLLATNDFGPFFGFTVSARASATLIGDDIAVKIAGGG